jgi:hypothetical protein
MAKFLISHLFVVCGKAWARPKTKMAMVANNTAVA